MTVSVPLRGKEGAGLTHAHDQPLTYRALFPSPCGVRRVRDFANKARGTFMKKGFRPLAG